MDPALRLLYGPCLASCEPSMVLVWRGYFWMDGLKSTRAIANCLDLLAASFSSQMTCWSKKKPAHRQSLSAKGAFCGVFLPFFRECLYISERKIGNFFRCQLSCCNGEMWQDLWTANEKQINAKKQDVFKILVNLKAFLLAWG